MNKAEILRINKIWLFSLNQLYGFAEKRLTEVYTEVNKQAADLYETPEQWYYVDEKLLDQYHMNDIFDREDISEREIAAKQIHKKHGKKWRQY